MIKFDGEELAPLIRRKRLLNKLSVAFFCVILIEALVVAALSGNAEKNWALYITLYAQIAAFAVLYVLFLLLFVKRQSRKITDCVNEIIANGFISREDFLGGTESVSLAVRYEGDILTVARTDYSGEIIIKPSSARGLDANGRGKIQFDLSALKPLPSAYSAVGASIWEFLQAYYCVNCAKGFGRVSVTDETGRAPEELVIIDGGKPCASLKRNYFIEKGLVK